MARRRTGRANNGGEMTFDFSSLTFDNEDEEQARAIPKLNMEPVCFEAAEELVDAIDWSQNYFCLVSGGFIFGDFIEALCFKKHLHPSAVYLTTLGMSQDNIDSIVNLVDYLKTEQVNLLVSHYFAGVERHGLIPYMETEFANKPVNVAVLQSHCKIAVIRSRLGDAVLCGSANLSSSNNVEQFCIIHDAPLIEWVQKRLDSIMRRFTIIRGLDGGAANWAANKKNTGKYAWEAIEREEA